MRDKTITISEKEFKDKLSGVFAPMIDDVVDVFAFSKLCTKIHMAFFDDEQPVKEAPFKEGDEVFVIDNKNDHNCFVNQVVTIINVGENLCDVTNGDTKQTIYFKNLRKVVN